MIPPGFDCLTFPLAYLNEKSQWLLFAMPYLWIFLLRMNCISIFITFSWLFILIWLIIWANICTYNPFSCTPQLHSVLMSACPTIGEDVTCDGSLGTRILHYVNDLKMYVLHTRWDEERTCTSSLWVLSALPPTHNGHFNPLPRAACPRWSNTELDPEVILKCAFFFSC